MSVLYAEWNTNRGNIGTKDTAWSYTETFSAVTLAGKTIGTGGRLLAKRFCSHT